jgi:two-component system, chemotaxis family, protein-glutamate methylesterase/glutaminase
MLGFTVIGASAGGVEALTTLVAGLPGNLRAALFLVMHLSATRPSALPQILSRWGPLPACHATEGMRIKQGKIYVAPPDHHLLLEPGSVHLGSGPKERHVRPAVDVLFRSAANAYGSRVVGVVLTGMDHDGTAVLQAVQQQGGVTVVQDPTEAAWPSMPRSALEQVAVDYVLPLAQLAPLLISLAEPSRSSSV